MYVVKITDLLKKIITYIYNNHGGSKCNKLPHFAFLKNMIRLNFAVFLGLFRLLCRLAQRQTYVWSWSVGGSVSRMFLETERLTL